MTRVVNLSDATVETPVEIRPSDSAPLVLVVDDSNMDRLIASRLITHCMRWRVATAANGAEALQAMATRQPALVLTDLRMPEMDGLELVETIRTCHPLVPVVLMTAHGSEDIAMEALQKGAASYVLKNNLADHLAETLERVHTSAKVGAHQQILVDCLSRQESQFILESNPNLVPPLVHHLQEQLNRFRLVGQTTYIRMGIALEEALLNGIYHGNLEVHSELKEHGEDAFHDTARRRSKTPPFSERRLCVKAEITRSEARFTITDEGPGFDPSGLADPTDPLNLERSSGRGLLLIRTFMDEVSFNGRGNQITLLKRRETHRDQP